MIDLVRPIRRRWKRLRRRFGGSAAMRRDLRAQAVWCAELGSPLYAHLLERTVDDVRRGGALARALAGHETDPPGSALPLRLLGSVHRIVLDGGAPRLARHYPSVGGAVGDLERAWGDFRDLVEAELERVRSGIERPVQTNEVGRSASLLGGFLTVARASGLPLRLLEIGASAGLNLRWDRYRYESGGAAFGPADSPVRFLEPFEHGRPPLDVAVRIIERRGCDPAPIDAASEEGRRTLLAYVWPDQTERFMRLRGALEVAAAVPVAIDVGDAPTWLGGVLAAPVPGSATVVFHSIVVQYLSREGRRELAETIRRAGASASPEAPLAWLRLEPEAERTGEPVFRVRLTLWPGGEDRALAVSSPHGPPVRWLG